MKSAYELAMERLGKSDPAAQPMTTEKKARLAEIDRVYKGRIAEREIFLRQQLDTALGAQKFDEADKIRKQSAGEKARLGTRDEEENVGGGNSRVAVRCSQILDCHPERDEGAST